MANSNPSPRSKTYLWLAALMAGLAIGVHGYLYAQHLALSSGEYTKSLCDINEKFDCSAVAASKYAVMLGVPVALWGLLANFAFLILVGGFLPLADENKKPAIRRNIWLVTAGILLGSVVMASVSVFLMSKFCAFCLTAYILSILLFIFVWLALKGQRSSSPFRLGDFVPAFSLAFAALIGGFVIQSSMNPNAEAMANAEKAYVSEWQSAPAREIATVDPLVMGPAADQAKMTIVEFADFRCIHCKHAAPILHAFVAAHPDVRFEFQPWPLDGECNSGATQLNGASCLLSRAVWCAQKLKQNGWKAHDFIYGREEIYPSVEAVRAGLTEIAASANISPDEMKTCADSDEAKTQTRKQADVGTALNLQGTPTIYVNKKPLTGGQSLPILQRAYGTL